MVSKALPHYKHFNAILRMNMRNHDNVDFNLPLTPANLANTLFNDKWEYLNHMYLGTTTPNSYVLGTPIPTKSGRTFSLSGTDAAKFGIGPTSGQIYLADNTGLAAGNLSINVVTSDLGSFPITVPVVGTSGYGFVDTVNGNDSNSGMQPHLPKRTFTDRSVFGWANNILFKRGSTVTASLKLANNTVYQNYGDPSQPRTILYCPTNETYAVVNAFKANGVSLQGCSNIKVLDFDIKGGSTCQRGVNGYNIQGATVKRCSVSGNISNSNSQGILFNGNCSNVIVRHCDTADGLYGDGCYLTATAGIEVCFNTFRTPFGGAGDCLQITGENNFSQRCSNAYVAFNILDYRVATNSGKGSVVIQETDRYCFEYNFCRGNYFGAGLVGSNCTARMNYIYDSKMSPTNSNEWALGLGANQYASSHDYHDNFILRSQRGLYLSGYSGPWDRVDLNWVGNTIALCSQALRATERWTGKMSNNILAANYDNSFTFAGNGNTAATVTGTITAIADNGDGTYTITCGQAHRLGVGNTVTISGVTGLSGSIAVLSVPSSTTFKVAGTGLVLVSGTYAKDLEFSTIDTTGNFAQTQLGTVLPSNPTNSGTCQDGQTVTCSASLPAGHTAVYEWSLNGRVVYTGAAYTIAGGSSSQTNKNMPTSRNFATLSCRVVVTDPQGNKSFVPAVWGDGLVYKQVVA